MNYIQNKLKALRKEYYDTQCEEIEGDEDRLEVYENDAELVADWWINKIQQTLTDYHNHIVEKIPKKIILKNMYGDGWNDAIEVISNNFSTLQDTNPNE